MTQAPAIARADTPRARTERARCAHCGLDVPPGLLRHDRTEQFCCAGCEGVWNVLAGAGLGAYYGVREAADATPRRPTTTGEGFEEYADGAYQRAFVRALPGGLCETEFLLEGVHCAACVWLLERLPRVAPGVTEARVGVRTGVVTVRYRPDAIALPAVARALDRLGYRPHPARGVEARHARVRSDRAFLIRVAVAGACAGNIMLVSIALYAGAFSGIDALWETVFRWVSMTLGVVALAWPGRVFFTGAIAALRTRTAHLDLPIALALAAGGAWGVANTVRGVGDIYFDSLSVLIFLLLVGRWVQHRQQRSATDSIELMLSLTPSSASIVEEGGAVRRVPIDAVEIGDLVEVRAGDTIPADGAVESGESSVDEAMLTGESTPRPVRAGDGAVAGSVNLHAPIRVRVDAVGAETRVGRLMARVAEAGVRRAPIVRLADRIAGWFVLIVLGLAGATFAIWAHAGVGVALDHTTALLIVACPCGLGLAIPLAMGVASGRAARAGALVKDAASLQALATPGIMFLDKTGTITEGSVTLLAWDGDQDLLGAVGALEGGSSHPIAMALAAHAGETHEVLGRVHTPGGGVRGVVDGRAVAVGSPAYLGSLGIEVGERWLERARAASAHAKTPVFVAAGGAVRAIAELGDGVREDSAPTIAGLKGLGWDVRVLSGDHGGVVDAVCGQVGLAGVGRGGATPEDKAGVVADLRARGERVVMVGDGVNDAAAMAEATVGVAVHGGAEASLEAADVYLAQPGLAPIGDLVERAGSTMRVVRLCLVASVAYNSAAAALAMGGLMSALLAAVLMPASSLAVVAVALHAGRTRAEGSR